MKKHKGFIGYVLTMSVFILLIAVFIFTSTLYKTEADVGKEKTEMDYNTQAQQTVIRYFKGMPDGRSYRAVSWGNVECDAYNAGTGTRNPIYGVTGEPPSRYSLVHRLKMKNGFGERDVFDVRLFFADETYTRIVGMEYMDSEDTDRRYLN